MRQEEMGQEKIGKEEKLANKTSQFQKLIIKHTKFSSTRQPFP